MKHPPKKFGCVAWDDAVGSGMETSEEEIIHAAKRFQIYGWIVRSDDRGVTIASEWAPETGEWRDRSFIPRGMVTEETVFPQPRKRRPSSTPSRSSPSSSSSLPRSPSVSSSEPAGST